MVMGWENEEGELSKEKVLDAALYVENKPDGSRYIVSTKLNQVQSLFQVTL
jgi:hypothetical protein